MRLLVQNSRHLPALQRSALRAAWTSYINRAENRTMTQDFGPTSQELALWRGGTSKGLFIQDHALQSTLFGPDAPYDATHDWLSNATEPLQQQISALLGSPDSYGRQLNGLGGGISSLSKAVILQRPEVQYDAASDADRPHMAYTFLQVGVEDGVVDMSGNCGNLTSAVGPFAVDTAQLDSGYESMIDFDQAYRIEEQGRSPHCAAPVTVNLLNYNTAKVIRSIFTVSRPYGSDLTWKFEPRGQFSMSGVPGTGSEIKLQWINPGGSKTSGALPTSKPADTIQVGVQTYEVSLVDVSNPGVFIDGRTLGWDLSRKPTELDSDTSLMQTLEDIRRRGAEMMGLDPSKPSIPKIVLVFPSDSDTRHIDCQALSMGKAHKAVPGTLALNLGAACQIPGTIPHKLARAGANGLITIGHPTGTADVGAKITDGRVDYVEISRTARCLMQGIAFPAPSDCHFSEMAEHEKVAARKH